MGALAHPGLAIRPCYKEAEKTINPATSTILRQLGQLSPEGELAQFIEVRNCLKTVALLAMARQHSHVTDHSLHEMIEHSTRHQIRPRLVKMHHFHSILRNDARIESPVDSVRGIVDQQRQPRRR